MPRQSLELELYKAKLAYQKKKDDIVWKHEVFWPKIEAILSGEVALDLKEVKDD